MTDNLLQYQDIDPAPSFSLSSSLHSNLPTPTITALSNEPAAILKSNKTSASISKPASKSTQYDNNSSLSFTTDSESSRIVSVSRVKVKPSLHDDKPVNSDSPENIQSGVNSSLFPKKHLKILIPSGITNDSQKRTSASAIIRPRFRSSKNENVDEITEEKEPSPSISEKNSESFRILNRGLNLRSSQEKSSSRSFRGFKIRGRSQPDVGAKNSKSESKSKNSDMDLTDVDSPTTVKINLIKETTESEDYTRKEEIVNDLPDDTVTLKPLTQLSPNASFVKILTRQIGEKPSDVQSIKSVKRLRWRPLNLSPASSTTQSVPTTIAAEYLEGRESSNSSPSEVKLIEDTSMATITEKVEEGFLKPIRKFAPSLKVFGHKIPTGRKADSKRPSLPVPKPSKINRFSSSRQSVSLLNIQPSYRLTSRLSSNHPSARIQSISSRPNSKKKFSLSSRSRPRDNSERITSSLSIGSRFPSRPPITIPIRPISSGSVFNRPPSRIFSNFKREPLTESPTKITVSTTTTKPQISITENVTTTTAFSISSIDTLNELDLENSDQPEEDYLLLEEDDYQDYAQETTENPNFDSQSSTTESTTLLNINDLLSDISKNTEESTTTESLLKETSAVTTTEKSTPQTSRSIYRLTRPTKEKVTVSTTTEELPKITSSSTMISTTTPKSAFKLLLKPTSTEDPSRTTEEIEDSIRSEPEEKTDTHPLLASLRKTHKNFDRTVNEKLNSGEETISVSTNESLNEDENNTKMSSLNSDSKLSLFPTRSVLKNPNSKNLTSSASSSTVPPFKPSAGRLGNLFPKPRSDVAVSARYVIELFS